MFNFACFNNNQWKKLLNYMKRISMIAMAVLLGAASLWARPALKGTVTVTQPDGSTVSLQRVGDEYLHFDMTSDGYTVVKNTSGFYVYAEKVGGQLKATAFAAHDAGQRSAAELTFLSGMEKRVAPDMNSFTLQHRSQMRAQRAQALSQMRAGRYDYSKFKGLVILVEYNDCSFRYDDYRDIMEHMINDENYQGEERTNIKRNATLQIDAATCTGSIRDFFSDNSMGQFAPTFDIVGPVKVNRSQKYPNGGSTEYDNYVRGQQLMIDACTAADDQVDFSDYDVDGDGAVDMVYFIYAGLPSYISGNDSRYLWPHQSDMRANRYPTQYVKKDGVVLGRYACSTELFGYEAYGSWSVLEGIGTMCHEFTHVLGLPDFYDADYEDTGGQSNHVSQWSVMADGADFNVGRTPCAFSLFERYALGFAMPQVITEPGQLELEDVKTSNTGYRMNTPVNKEFFMIENRQNTKWDAKLPGHGMLIFRVDSTSTSIWTSNSVNNNPRHQYYELVRAGGVKTTQYGFDSSSDPFPGTDRITEVTNTTEKSNLKTWAGRPSPFGFRHITETGGKISFEVFDVNVLTEIRMAESASMGVGTTLQLQTELVPEDVKAELTWTSDNEAVATVSASGLVTGVSEGTATVTATAANGVSASCVVTVRSLPVAENIAAFRQLEEGSEALLQLDGQVLYVDGTSIYVRDASGSIVLSGTDLEVNRWDILSGTIYGRRQTTDRMPQLAAVAGSTNSSGLVISSGTAAEPIALHSSQLTDQYYAEMVTVKRAGLVRDGGIWLTYGDHRARLYNTLKISNIKVPTDLTKRYDITAIYGTNTLNGEVIDELYLLSSPTAVSYTVATSLQLPSAITMEAGRTYQLSAAIEPSAANVSLEWTTSDAQVATVSNDGLVTAVANGIATITVTDLETGLKAACQVTVGDRLVASNIAAFKALPEGAEADLTLTDAQVLYAYKTDTYVRDASSALLLRNMPFTPAANQLLNGKLFGTLTTSSLVPVLLPVDGITSGETVTASQGAEAEPRAVTMDQLSPADLSDLVIVKAAQLERDGGIYAVGNGIKARVYNAFGISGITVPATFEGRYYDITAIFGTNTLTDGTVIYELKLTKPLEEVEDPTGIVSVQTHAAAETFFDMNGRRLSAEPQHGVYLVRKDGRFVKRTK